MGHARSMKVIWLVGKKKKRKEERAPAGTRGFGIAASFVCHKKGKKKENQPPRWLAVLGKEKKGEREETR